MDRKQLKEQAKQAMSAARPAPYWVSLVLVIILVVLQILALCLDGTIPALRAMLSALEQGEYVYVQPQASGFMSWLLGIAVQVMGTVMSVGFLLYVLRVWRRQSAGYGDMFDAFGVFLRVIWIQLLPALLVGVWTLLYVLPATMLCVMTGQAWPAAAALPLLIPALAASYAYQLAPFIMLDRPDLSCWQCVQLSRQVMHGHKWELFVLNLSFLGWQLLCLVPVAGLLLMIWVNAYTSVTLAGYYDGLARAAGVVLDEESVPSPGPQPPEF